MILLIVCCTIITGCGSPSVSQEEYESVVAERDALKKELDKNEIEEKEKDELNILYNEKYIVDGEEVSMILGEEDGKINLTFFGETEDKEKAYLMFVTFLAECKNIEKLVDIYSVVINCGDLNITYITSESGSNIVGTNKDGSTTLGKPDWIPEDISELTMKESDIEKYLLQLDSKIMEFGKLVGYNMGVLIEQDSGDDLNGQKESTIVEKEEKTIYQDENVIITYTGISGKEDDYTINLLIENLSDKTLQISDKDVSINGYMADPLFVVTVAPGKKARDGMRMYYNRAEDFPMSEVKSIEAKFHIANDDDWSDRYDTENVVIVGE